MPSACHLCPNTAISSPPLSVCRHGTVQDLRPFSNRPKSPAARSVHLATTIAVFSHWQAHLSTTTRESRCPGSHTTHTHNQHPSTRVRHILVFFGRSNQYPFNVPRPRQTRSYAPVYRPTSDQYSMLSSYSCHVFHPSTHLVTIPRVHTVSIRKALHRQMQM